MPDPYREPAGVVKYEYKFLADCSHQRLESEANRLGAMGFRLVPVATSHGEYKTYVMEREVK